MDKKKSLLKNARLYALLSNISSRASIIENAELLIKGGADIIQLREKSMPDDEFADIADELVKITANTETIFIINDRVEIAKKTDADGVHIGQDDMDIAKAREILGKDKIIGVSTHNQAQAIEAKKAMPDYIAIGPAFPTATKSYEPVAGVEIVRQTASAMFNNKEKDANITNVPIFAIGGITLSNINKIFKAGVLRVAISAAIIDSNDVAETTRKFKTILNNVRP